jgi:hypothetical protein
MGRHPAQDEQAGQTSVTSAALSFRLTAGASRRMPLSDALV